MPLLIIIFILVLIICCYLKSPTARGKRGEEKVKWQIGETGKNDVSSFFDTEEDLQYTINNLTLINNGKTCQIDHVVINARGVFVIETKNYSGRIYGSEKSREWTQVLAYGKEKHKFYNPLKQNATHVYNVKKIIGNLPVYSLVVFTQNNTQYIRANNAIPLNQLKNTLKQGFNVLTNDQMQKAYNALMSKEQNVSIQEHVQNIRERKYNANHGICPNCKGKLILRNGRYGEFFGCSNYPKCKYVKNIK